ncbi:glycoside hydrolase family 15 protein, partial [Bdellovibrionota bacterium FG-2]
MNNHRFSWVIAVLFLLFGCGFGWAMEPPGKPGIPHRWGPALKQAVGTSVGARSPVWFTLAEGILTEVYYPTVDHPQVGDLQFVVTDGVSFFSEQKRDTNSQVSYRDDGMAVVVRGVQKDERYSFEQVYVADTEAPVVRVHTRFVPHQSGLRLFVLFKPALDYTGAGDLGFANPQGLFASGEKAHTALVSSVPWRQMSAGYTGFSDGWQELSKHFELSELYPQAGPGNVALVGELKIESGAPIDFDLSLGFGATSSDALLSAQTSLATPFSTIQTAYEAGWKKYAASLSAKSAVSRQSAQIIKMHEDKQNPGAIVAALSKPSLPGPQNAGDEGGGYHLVWPRDLYHAAMGLLAAGDAQTPLSVLRYYERTQKKDGSWNQNFWVTGEPYWTGLQMDEVAFPILLAAQLKDHKGLLLKKKDISMVCNAARFLVNNGPKTGQDRWEEIGGFVPSTIAAEIAALRAADRMVAQQCADVPMRATAELWASRLEQWMVVSNGPHGQGYY